MSNAQKQAPSLDTVLLNNILVVTSTTQCVSITPSNSSLYYPAVSQAQWYSALCGLISMTMHPYVTVFPLGTSPLGMKKVVLFPLGMRVTTTWASFPRSLVNAFIYISASGPCHN